MWHSCRWSPDCSYNKEQEVKQQVLQQAKQQVQQQVKPQIQQQAKQESSSCTTSVSLGFWHHGEKEERRERSNGRVSSARCEAQETKMSSTSKAQVMHK
mmetsp:Transcript_23169/g.37160  ORF Transcript_23169/g.37160 Transcript_23169/m.37160 type:complete len:99 (+) Transcript_23169:1121-1417(+)